MIPFIAHRFSRRLFLMIPLMVIVLAFYALPAHAATFNIGCAAGVGDTPGLVTAINTANGTVEADTINLTAGCVYTLAAQPPDITSAITINGFGSASIDGAGAFKTFIVQVGGNLALNGVTVQNAKTLGFGAGLFNAGTATITGSTFSNNESRLDGAAISNNGTLTVINSAFLNNRTQGGSLGSNGSAIGNSGFATLINSTFSGNTADNNTTFINFSGTMAVINSTIANNEGGFLNFGTLTIQNSIISNNPPSNCGSSGTISIAYTLIEGGGCDIANGVNGNKTSSPSLGTLTGSPAYFPIQAGSPPHNAGNNINIPGGITTDQAGNPRIRGGTVDMGSFEAAQPIVTLNKTTLSASEGAVDTVDLSRAAVTSFPLTVNLTLTRGTNMAAGEYVLSGGSISGQVGNVTATIPAGSASVTLTFTANDDGSAAEAANTLTIALVAAGAYDLGATTSAFATIPENGTTVSTLNDNSTDEGTLRQAVLNANSVSSNDTISFTVSGIINLTSPLPDVVANGRIIVNGGNGITISGNSTHRSFNVLAGADLRLNQLTIQNSFAAGDGGALHNTGLLQLNRVTVQNSATSNAGGGIRNDSGATLTLINSTVTGNVAVNGGGIANSGTAFIVNSTIANNGASTSGAGLYNPGAATLQNSIIADNVTSANCFGSVVAQNSLIEDGSCGIVNGVDANKTGDPTLGALTGSPAYFPLLTGSIAINAGSNALVLGGVTTDQPGNARIIDTTVDMGAFESTPASLNLTLAMQGRPTAPNPAYVISVQVQIRQAGSTTPVATLNLVSDASGQVTISGMTAWNYDIWVKGSHTLARLSNMTLSAGANSLTTPILLEGDANNNNSVLLADFSLLASAFATAVGDPAYNAQADFNNDGTIQLIDFSLLASNYSQIGAP